MAEAQATDFLRHAATSRIKSHHRSFFTSADIGHIIDLKSGRASTTVARQRRGAGGAKKKTAASSLLQELAVPIEFSEKVLKTMDVDASIDGKPVLVRMQPLHDSEGPRKVPVIAVEDVPAVIEQQLEVLGTVGPANLFYHMRHHMPFALAPGPDGKPRVIRGACGFTEESIVLYMAGDPYYVDTKPMLASEQPPPHPLDGFLAPFHHCQTDVLRLGEDENDTQARPEKFQYVLMYVCLFTRRVWLRALRSKCAIGVAREIYFLWMDTMVPGKLQTDNGSEFANWILNKLCKEFGVQFIHGCVGRPQSQGCSERANRECRDTARTNLMRAPTTSWPEQIMRVQDMINNRPCSVFSNKKPRNYVLFGALPYSSKRPSVEDVNDLLQFDSGW